MGGMLFLITIFCALFALLKWVNSPGVVYLVATLFVLVVGGAQMRWGETPRVISIISGAIFLPAIVVGIALTDGERQPVDFGCFVFALIPIGALFGYIAGAVLAGFFLISRMIDSWSERDRGKPTDSFTSTPPPPSRWNEQPMDAEVVDESTPWNSPPTTPPHHR